MKRYLWGFIFIILHITANDVMASLKSSDKMRLKHIGSGYYKVTPIKEDLLLIKNGFSSDDAEDRQWAYLAIEKLAYDKNILDEAFIQLVFSQLLKETTSKGDETSEFAYRAIGALSRYTVLLTQKQCLQAYEQALVNLQNEDYNYRRKGVNLLGDLICCLDRERVKEAISLLLQLFEDWQQIMQTHNFCWNDFERTLSLEDNRELSFRRMALSAFLKNCQYIQEKEQVLMAYHVLITAIKNKQLDLFALKSVADLAGQLPPYQRQEAIDFIIARIPEAMYVAGFGIGRLANYANDAILVLIPFLPKEDILYALETITSPIVEEEDIDHRLYTIEDLCRDLGTISLQSLSEEEHEKVFGKTIEALNEQLQTIMKQESGK